MKKYLSICLIPFLTLLLSCADDHSEQNEKEIITLDNITSGRPYSPGVLKDGMLFVSGQIAVNPETGKMVAGGIEDQTDQALKNLKAIVEKAGFTLDEVVKCTVLLSDIADYGAMNEIYAGYFPSEPPARKAFAVKDLPLGALVEIDALAVK